VGRVLNDFRTVEGDEEGLSRLSRYIACGPVAEAKITQDSVDDDVIYNADHSNPLPFQQWRANPDSQTTRGNFDVFDPLDFLARDTQHIPDRGQHLTRYHGWYSNKSRGMRAKEDNPGRTDAIFVGPAPEAHQGGGACAKMSTRSIRWSVRVVGE